MLLIKADVIARRLDIVFSLYYLAWPDAIEVMLEDDEDDEDEKMKKMKNLLSSGQEVWTMSCQWLASHSYSLILLVWNI